jgi:hypothetical protein
MVAFRNLQFKCLSLLEDSLLQNFGFYSLIWPWYFRFNSHAVLRILFSCRWTDLLETIKTILPPKAWNSLSPELYATFWGLTLYDLHFPKDRYDAEIKKLHENLKQLEDNSDNSSIEYHDVRRTRRESKIYWTN